MEEKKVNQELEEKKEIQETEENSAEEKEENKNNKDHKPSEEDLEFMISEVESRLGIDRSQFKIVKYKQKRNFKDILVDIGISFFINIILIMSITGFIKWAAYDSALDIILFAVVYSVIEIGLKYLLLFIFRKKLFKSMLLIMTLPTLLAILISLIINNIFKIATITTESVELVLIMFSILILLRYILKIFIIRRRRRIVK